MRAIPKRRPAHRIAGAFALVVGLVAPLAAEEPADAALLLELNRADTDGDTCRLTFLAENRTGADLSEVTLETVLIDTGGIVDRLTLFEFGALPVGTPRVRQFDLPGLVCENLGRVLVNGVSACGMDDCAFRIDPGTRTEIGLQG